ncbi:MAG: cell division protein FtsZ, partial [Methanomassiliicoccales archaeon]
DLKDAKGALIRVVGGPDMTVAEAQRAAEIVTNSVNERARIIWGCSIEPELKGTIKVLLIVTGARSKYMLGRSDYDYEDKLVDELAPRSRGKSRRIEDDDGIDFVR